MVKPRLEIDLQGTNGNIYVVIGKARQIVPGEQLNDFLRELLDAAMPGVHTTYEDMLAIIHKYVELSDTSGLYPQYGGRPMDEAAIIAAVERLNEQLQTLPDSVPCSIDGLYPDFEFLDCGPEMYLVALNDELKDVEEKLAVAPDTELQRLREMLIECAVALGKAGVQ